MAFCPTPAWKRFACLSILAGVTWYLTFFPQQSFSPAEGALAHNDPLTVLLWDWPFRQPLNITGDICATLYHIEGCRLISNRSLYGQVDVVAFHHRELQGRKASLPKSKGPEQAWVWVSLESPSYTADLSRWNSTFNWTMTYRQDSDIFVPYGELVPRPSDHLDIPQKTGLVCWVVSHYHRSQKRAQLYRNLSRHIKIDMYGKASQKPLCPACLLQIISQYKFYLALENSVHRDYITEKLWRNALMAEAVPVVMGPPRSNYQQFLPADAFIHVDDFASPAELASFLTTMNESHYRSFFEWRQKYTVKLYTSWPERFCTICQRYPSLPRGKVYPDLERWFRN
ncbi:alpha-(1,3)-fucosyltransferase 7 [Hemicordylus capensis]|uniref:alpha-(1,3)-fucosyltransferase 7 n=1 Tax=Hemicordylus capensis TaxID=884348 RepID=UPI002303637B|nr:alpha-(1,3)-fucosyltransferase 7 [Hemicordylus capensis]